MRKGGNGRQSYLVCFCHCTDRHVSMEEDAVETSDDE